MGPLLWNRPAPEDAGQIGSKSAVPDYRVNSGHDDSSVPPIMAGKDAGEQEQSSSLEELIGWQITNHALFRNAVLTTSRRALSKSNLKFVTSPSSLLPRPVLKFKALGSYQETYGSSFATSFPLFCPTVSTWTSLLVNWPALTVTV